MTSEIVFWYWSVIVAFAFFFISKREFDFFSVGYISTVVYFLPLFFGFTRVSLVYYAPVSEALYMMAGMVVLVTTSTAYLIDKINVRTVMTYSSNSLLVGFFLVVSLIGFIGMVSTSGDVLLSSDKQEMMDHLNRFSILYEIGFILGAVSAYLGGANRSLSVFLFLVMVDVFLGFRSSAAIVFIAISLLWLNHHGKMRLIELLHRRWVASLALFLGGLFFFFYKGVYVAVKEGDWQHLMYIMSHKEYYISTITFSEPFVTQSILNEVVRSNFSLNPSYLLTNGFQVIPYSDELGLSVIGFNSLFQPELFPEVSSGMAGNWWAEWFAVSGWTGFSVGLLIYVGGLAVFSLMLRRWRFNRVRLAVVVVMGVFWAFYIHRNEITYFITLEKRVFGLWLLSVFCVSIAYLAAKLNRVAH